MNCHYCEWRCNLTLGDGKCQMYTIKNGVISEKYPHTWSRCQGEEMEDIPIFHYLPAERILQLGSFSCNASCAYCMNSTIAIPNQDITTFIMKPEQIVDLALRGGYRAIHFGINEVTVSLPSALETAKLAQESGLICGCSTNGYFTKETAEAVAEAFAFFNISLKSLRDEFYRAHLGLPSVMPVMRNIRYLAKHAHVEITTPITRENKSEMTDMAAFIANIDQKIPWHLFRLLPANRMQADTPPEVMSMVNAVAELKQRPQYIYLSNFVGSKWVNTTCPHCGKVVVSRLCEGSCGSRFLAMQLENGSCIHCGTKQDLVLGV